MKESHDRKMKSAYLSAIKEIKSIIEANRVKTLVDLRHRLRNAGFVFNNNLTNVLRDKGVLGKTSSGRIIWKAPIEPTLEMANATVDRMREITNNCVAKALAKPVETSSPVETKEAEPQNVMINLNGVDVTLPKGTKASLYPDGKLELQF